MAKITTQGNGKVFGTPDKATINVSVKTIKKTATEAREAHAPVVQKLNAAVLAAGVEAKDIQSSNFAFGQHTKYNRTTNENVADGFYASNTVTVVIKDLKKVSELLDACVKGGATNIDGPNLAIEKPRTLEDEARVAAFKDAKVKAELYCKTAGLTLGLPVEMVEERVHTGHRAGKMAMMAESTDGGGDELMVGQMEVAINLNVVWEATPKA